MKTPYFLSLISMICLAQFNQLSAQCSFVNPGVELNSVTTDGVNCTVNVNLSFTIDKNNGNKFTYVHLWTPSQYPNIDYKKAPKATDLGPVLATLAINTDGVATLLSTYSPDPTNVIPLFTGVTIIEQNISGDLYKITIANIQFPIPGACSSIPVLKGDVWSTQAASAQPPVHCYFQNFNLSINDPIVSGSINCNLPAGPRTYDLDITTTNPTAFGISYKLYLDDGILISGQTVFGPGDNLFYTSSTTNISSILPIAVSDVPYPYSAGESTRSIWAEISGPSLPNSIIAELSNNCSPLPVKLAKFKGDLLDDVITLSWSTTAESRSSHFDIQRSDDRMEFMTIGRVIAKGNSETKLNYNYLDISPVIGNNYYRLKLVDKDGSFENSRIISVANNANSVSFEILGNPIVNRELKFLLKGEKQQNVQLYDISGRTVPFSMVNTGNIYTMKPANNLSSGLYILSLQNQGNLISKKVLVP